MAVLFDIVRFALTWVAVSSIVIMLDTCPECGSHHLGHGNYTPVVAGFFGAIFFHLLRLRTRKNKGMNLDSVKSDSEPED